MTEDQKSYRQIFKATSLFGGVQLFNIIVAIIRSKFVAVLLGPTGMGISGLLTSTTGFISSLTNFGLGTSAIKNVASASSTGDATRVSFIASVLNRLVWVTGILGTLVTAVLSPLLSRITFGNSDFTFAFIWISITLLFQQLTNGRLVILQGLRKLEFLAKANLLGSLAGLIITVPLYYYLRLKGIVPAIIILSVTSFVLSIYYARKTEVHLIKVTLKKTLGEGKEMLSMGFMLSLAGLVEVGISYIIRIFISNTGGVEVVGLYNAGFAIINIYVGMVFTAMSTDYFPRLSAVANENHKSTALVNQQSEVAILILAPILTTVMVFIHWVILILFSVKFMAVSSFLLWAALGIYFKAVSWSVGFIFLSKGDSGLYFWNEIIGNAYMLLLNLAGFKIGGLEGLGISFLVGYLIYFIQVLIVTRIKYLFKFEGMFYRIGSIQLAIGIVCLVIMKLVPRPYNMISGALMVSLSLLFSSIELEKRVGIVTIIKNVLKELKGKIVRK